MNNPSKKQSAPVSAPEAGELQSVSPAAANTDALDAARWRLLPAFIEEHQINYVSLVRQIDAELQRTPAAADAGGRARGIDYRVLRIIVSDYAYGRTSADEFLAAVARLIGDRASATSAAALSADDEVEFRRAVETGTKAWAGTPDTWLEELRGDDGIPAAKGAAGQEGA
jgi:hypothetical protein